MAALRERIDPVFLPRPLVFVDALPRNAPENCRAKRCKQLVAARQSATGNPA